MQYVYSDGGRLAAGFKGVTGDCVTRSIAIATGLPYDQVYKDLNKLAKEMGDSFSSARTGVHRRVYEAYLLRSGAKWTATMEVGSGCRMHLREGEVPSTGRHILRLSRHMCALVDGKVYDNHDPTRGGNRCVYGYYTVK